MAAAIVTIAVIAVIALPVTLIYLVLQDVLLDRSRFFEFKKTLPAHVARIFAIGSVSWLLGWWCFFTYGGFVNPKFLPYPHQVATAFFDLFANEQAYVDVGYSLMRIFIGFFVGALLGSFLGLLAGTFQQFHAIIMPPNSFLRYIPPTAFVGLFVLWFGLDEPFKIALIFAGVFFYIVLMVTDEVLKLPEEYLDVAFTLGANRKQIFWRVVVPATLPDILLVCRVNLGQAWIMLVIAEYIASQFGLGHIINVGQRFLDTPRLFAAIFLVGLIGLLLDLGFERLMRVFFPWRRHYGV